MTKDINVKLLLEMMVNCRRSDRELAKIVDVSQPTITRARRFLESQGFIREYTVFPDFEKVGIELVAFTFFRLKTGSGEEYNKIRSTASAFFEKNPNVVMALRGEGMGHDGIMVSLHTSFADFTSFMRDLKMTTSGTEVVGNFLASMKDGNQYRDLTFKSLKDYINSQ